MKDWLVGGFGYLGTILEKQISLLWSGKSTVWGLYHFRKHYSLTTFQIWEWDKSRQCKNFIWPAAILTRWNQSEGGKLHVAWSACFLTHEKKGIIQKLLEVIYTSVWGICATSWLIPTLLQTLTHQGSGVCSQKYPQCPGCYMQDWGILRIVGFQWLKSCSSSPLIRHVAPSSLLLAIKE